MEKHDLDDEATVITAPPWLGLADPEATVITSAPVPAAPAPPLATLFAEPPRLPEPAPPPAPHRRWTRRRRLLLLGVVLAGGWVTLGAHRGHAARGRGDAVLAVQPAALEPPPPPLVPIAAAAPTRRAVSPAEAARPLAEGRYAEALPLYLRLAADHPGDDTYRTVAELLIREARRAVPNREEHDMRARAIASLIVATGVLLGCDTPPATQRYAVVFAGRTDTGRPLPGVQIAANGRTLGQTGPEGGLAVDLRAVEGKRLQVSTTCPDGFRAASDDADLRLRRVVGTGAGNQVTVAVECRPTTRRAVVLIRTPRLAGVPVLFRDREIARTDGDGVAHVFLTMPPETRFQLALDTHAHPRLRPHDPTAAFVLGDADQVFVFDYQPVPDPAKPKRKKIRRASPPPPGPVKIESLRRRGHR